MKNEKLETELLELERLVRELRTSANGISYYRLAGSDRLWCYRDKNRSVANRRISDIIDKAREIRKIMYNG